MKIRIRFAKWGVMKFIGHLDVMRYFQKVMRRAKIDICYSTGYSPHQIMSFAQPLGVGVESCGEYFDIEAETLLEKEEALKRMNDVMADGICVLDYVEVPENAPNSMSAVAMSEYEIGIRNKAPIPNDVKELKEFIDGFMKNQSEIRITKKTKKGEKEIDIKPFIYKMEVLNEPVKCFEFPTGYEEMEPEQTGNVRLFLQLAAGSANNIKPNLVLEAICSYLGKEYCFTDYAFKRLDLYRNCGTEEEPEYCSLGNP